MKKIVAALGAAGLLAFAAGNAAAEVDEVKLAQQFGIGYLPLTIMQANKLVEKHLAKAGLPNTKVSWTRFASGGPMNDAILSGNLHVASGGVAPMLILYDKSKGQVKSLGALCSMPLYMVTNRPEMKTLKDMTPTDRIAIPGAGHSIQTIILEMASKKVLGDHKALSTRMVSLPHPEALAALLSKRDVTAYFGSPPFQYVADASPGIHRVINSYDYTGPKSTFLVTWASGKFRAESPKSWGAVVAALDEAMTFINKDKRAAAEIYVREAKDKSGVDAILKIMNDPDVEFTGVPKSTIGLAEFMHSIGRLKTKPASWKDYFHPEVHGRAGS